MRIARSVVASVLLLAPGCAAASQPPALPSPAPVTGRSQKPDPATAPAIRLTTFESAAVPAGATPEGRVAVQVRAQVNGVAILDEEIRSAAYGDLIAAAQLPEPERSQRQAEVFRRELDAIIDREIILQDAFARLSKSGPQYLDKLKAAASREFDKQIRQLKKKTGCKTDDELKDFLRNFGQSLEGMRRQAERKFIATEYVRNRVFPAVERVGHQQTWEYYTGHAEEFRVPDGVEWQDIFVDASRYPSRAAARQSAEQVAARARAGAPVADLLKYDNGDGAYRNGAGLGRLRGEIRPPEAEPLLFQMRDGQVAPVIEIPTGFHVVRLVKRQYAGVTPLDEKTQSDIRKRLQMEVFEREVKRLVAELRAEATIEVAGAP